jgi:6,7-dimethyl-8-ribityllumazine synthase
MKTGYAAPDKPAPGEFEDVRIAVVATRWNVEIVDALIDGAYRCLADWGVPDESVEEFYVPGAYEIPLAVSTLMARGDFDGVVTVGAVIRGDTPHFELVAGECSRGLMDVQLRHGAPVGFGVLTVNTTQQALDRAGPGEDNKGYEATSAMLEMVRMIRGVA